MTEPIVGACTHSIVQVYVLVLLASINILLLILGTFFIIQGLFFHRTNELQSASIGSVHLRTMLQRPKILGFKETL